MGVRKMIRIGAAGAVVAAAVGFASPARAEACLPLPPTTGATIEAAGQQVRVPATSGVAVCVETPGLPGLPRVDTGGSAVSIVLGGGSSAQGYVAVRYALDGSPSEQRVPIPGSGGSEICVASVGDPARADCLVKVSVDEMPTAPPLPTVPPVPTVPPLPTVSPEPLPTVPPVETPTPDPFCHRSTCIPYGGSILQGPYDVVQELAQQIGDIVQDILADPQCNETYCIVGVEPICIGKTPSDPIICVP